MGIGRARATLVCVPMIRVSAYHLGIGRARATFVDADDTSSVAYHLGIGRARATMTKTKDAMQAAYHLGIGFTNGYEYAEDQRSGSIRSAEMGRCSSNPSSYFR